jgi:hypothetical protein
MLLGMTPHFIIRVWGDTPETVELARWFIPRPSRQLLCDIEIDTTEPGRHELTISGHRGLDLIPQKMLAAAAQQEEQQ